MCQGHVCGCYVWGRVASSDPAGVQDGFETLASRQSSHFGPCLACSAGQYQEKAVQSFCSRMCSCLTFTLQLSHVPHLHPTWGLSDILQACFSGCLLGLSFQRLCLITEGVSRITEFRSSHHGSVVMNLTGIHEDEDFVLFCFAFLGLCPQHMDVPRLGVESELQLLAYATVTAMQDLSHICNLHRHS